MMGEKDPRDFPEDEILKNGKYFCYCYLCSRNFYGHISRNVCKLCVEEAEYLRQQP